MSVLRAVAADEGPLWSPDNLTVDSARLTAFIAWLRSERGLYFGGYTALHEWSVQDLEGFWDGVREFFGVRFATPAHRILDDRSMPGASWFPGARLNYAEHLLEAEGDGPAIVELHEEGPATEWSRLRLRQEVSAFAAHLRGHGVQLGDRVVAYLPNTAEAVVAFLASASIGAVWAVCGPEFGTASVIARFAPLEPKVLIASVGYRFGGKRHDRADAVNEIRQALPTLRETVAVGGDVLHATPWQDAVATPAVAEFDHVPFDHPLWVVFSSGTTGAPKGIVHGHGGILLEHLKYVGLHIDLRPGDRFFWYTSTSWMMWNVVVSALATGSTVVLYDGSPVYPGPDRLWRIAGELGINVLGVSPAYLHGSMSEGLAPARDNHIQALRTLHAAGSPLSGDAFRWANEHVGEHIPVISGSGGTDVASAFVSGNPLSPIYVGEISGPCLGVDVQAWDDNGSRLVGQVGELVVVSPMPSMPLYFWNDPTGSRLHASYFDTYPGVWRHGDWIEFTDHGTAVIHGRSDSTLNRNGVRMGTAEIYQAVESLPEIHEALAVGVEKAGGDYWMPLFVVLRPGHVLDYALRDRLVDIIRRDASPRHVPDDIIEVPGIPHTLTGKKLEIPVKRMLQGRPAAIDPDAVDNAELLQVFAALSRQASI
ncbi:acetoacetate--CoA ligase [soil metagenome]